MVGGSRAFAALFVSYSLIVRSRAEQDLAGASLWYEGRAPGTGAYFVRCVEAAISLIIRQPQAGPVYFQQFRRVLMPRFPFGIFYNIESSSTPFFTSRASRKSEGCSRPPRGSSNGILLSADFLTLSLKSRGRHRCSARHRDVVASSARDQRALARREPDLPLPGGCRLGRHDPRGAVRCPVPTQAVVALAEGAWQSASLHIQHGAYCGVHRLQPSRLGQLQQHDAGGQALP